MVFFFGYISKEGIILFFNLVCRLKKLIYGLKQVSRQWFFKFSFILRKLKFKKFYFDYILFVRNNNGKYFVVLVYVDDIIIVSNDDMEVERFKDDLKKVFKLCDLGELKYFLGLEIARLSTGILVCQRKYILEFFEEIGMLVCKFLSIFMDFSLKLV